MEEINATAHVRLAGYYTFEVFNPDTGKTRKYGPFKNIITQGGLNYLGTFTPTSNNLTVIGSIAVGSSGTTPALSDTALGSQVVRAVVTGNPSNVTFNATGLYFTANYQVVYAQGAAAGNLAEVGAYTTAATTGGTLFSRSLLLDLSGNPTVITVIANEILTVNYEMRVYQSQTDQTGTIVLNGNTYNWTIRPSWQVSGSTLPTTNPSYLSPVGYASGSVPIVYPNGSVLGTVAGTLTGTASSVAMSTSKLSVAPYVSNSGYLDLTLALAIGDANVVGGIAGFGSNISATSGQAYAPMSCGLGKWQMQFSPSIPKDNTYTLSLTFRISWSN